MYSSMWSTSKIDPIIWPTICAQDSIHRALRLLLLYCRLPLQLAVRTPDCSRGSRSARPGSNLVSNDVSKSEVNEHH